MTIQKKLVRVLIPIVIALILLGVCTSATTGHAGSTPSLPTSATNSPIAPDLRRMLSETSPDGAVGEYVPIIVYLRAQPHLDAVLDGASNATEARTRIVAALQDTAGRSQSALIAYLNTAKASGHVEEYTQLWIVNAIAVRARSSVVYEIAARPEVASVHLDHYRQWLPENLLETLPPDVQAATADSQAV